MEEGIASDLATMRKAQYEAQDREMAWNPTSYHGFESTSTYQEGLPYGNYVEENQYGYGERHQSWNMEYGYEEANGYQEAYGYDQGVYNYEDVYGYEGGHYYQEAYGYEEASPSPSNEKEEICNLLKLVLEGQESYRNTTLKKMDAIEDVLERNSRNLSTLGKMDDEVMLIDGHEESPIVTPSTSTKVEDSSSFTLPYVIEKKEHKRLSWAEIEEVVKSWDEESDKAQLKDLETSSSISEKSKEVGKDTIEEYPLSEINALKEELKYLPNEGTFHLEDVEIIRELECLLDHMVDENCVITNEDPCEDVGDEECMEDTREKSLVDHELSPKEHMHCQPILKQESKVEEPLEKQDNFIHLAFKEGYEEESPKAKFFSKHLGINLTMGFGIDDHWKLPLFEEVRMKEFGGWFYDEYDPGDPT